MTNKEKRAALLIDGTKFQVKGIDKTYEAKRYTEDSSDGPGSGMSVREHDMYALSGMNIRKITANAIYLYDYTPFLKRVTETIKLNDITIVE
jgi:hypothetical protein